MSEDFKATANSKGTLPRVEVLAAIRSLKFTAQHSPSDIERLHAQLQLERLGETI